MVTVRSTGETMTLTKDNLKTVNIMERVNSDGAPTPSSITRVSLSGAKCMGSVFSTILMEYSKENSDLASLKAKLWPHSVMETATLVNFTTLK